MQELIFVSAFIGAMVGLSSAIACCAIKKPLWSIWSIPLGVIIGWLCFIMNLIAD